MFARELYTTAGRSGNWRIDGRTAEASVGVFDMRRDGPVASFYYNVSGER